MEEIKQLTPKEINKFCDETISMLMDGRKICLCYALNSYLELNCIYGLESYNDASLFISEFTNDNAVIHANAEKAHSNGVPWWERYVFYFDYNNRILFLEWIKSQYPVTLKEE